MISQQKRHFGPQGDRENWFGPRSFRGHQRPSFFYGHPGHHRTGGHWQQPTPEQQALRSNAAEVAKLFVIAARSSHGDAEKQGQLRSFLDRSRKELSDFIYGTSQQSQNTTTENTPEVEQA
jgi:hypothetical protein